MEHYGTTHPFLLDFILLVMIKFGGSSCDPSLPINLTSTRLAELPDFGTENHGKAYFRRHWGVNLPFSERRISIFESRIDTTNLVYFGEIR